MKMAFHISFLILKPLLLLSLRTLLSYTKGCVDRERLALLDFKKSFPPSPQNIGKLWSWNSNEGARNCCLWEGITCDYYTGHVVSLDLSNPDLESYQLRPSLLQLHYLGSVDLSNNNLAMRIPSFIGSLSKLTSLQLQRAGFFGTIPPQLGNLSKIQTLDLSGNTLSSDNIQWLSHLSSLQSLDLSNLNLSEARDWVSVIRKLPILSDITCFSCYFPTQNSPSTSNLSSSLRRVYLSGNHLSAFSLSSLLVNITGNLSELDLGAFELGIPFSNIFHDLISLHGLYLSDTHLEDGIINSIGNLCNLSTLVVEWSTTDYNLPSILQALSGCASSSLWRLHLTFMNFTGIVPPTLLNFTSLIALDLSSNGLDNLLNNTLSIFPASLIRLNLENNNLHGLLTDVYFTDLSQLDELRLANNPNLIVSFSTKTPPSLAFGDFSSCNLGPSFPRWLLAHNSFWYLDISHSKILGTIPIMFWRNLPQELGYLNLSSNSLCGTVPSMPFDYFFVFGAIIDLSLNAFSGSIPFFLFGANDLHLSYNNFSGFALIPYPYNSSMKFVWSPNVDYQYPPWKFPNVINLSNNLLSGLIPDWIGLQIPNLSGTIPTSIGHTTNLYVLSLRNNSFSGSLPYVLKNCSQLRILDLGGNRFSGFIPSWVGENLRNLRVLSLSSNNLTGTLPNSLCQASSLQILDLSYNLLSGNILSCIQIFTGMSHNVSSINVRYPKKDEVKNGVPLEEVYYYNAYITWKSRVWMFQSILHLVKLIDLSSNNFSGEIPMGLASLVELDSIDLSCNSLQGSIPEQIGQLKSLQVLNLSHNRLLGQIPPSLSQISSLEMLDLSHNNLSGRIPKGTQLQSFNPSDFAGNPYLCGLPLDKCPRDNDDSVQALKPSPIDESETEDKWSDKEGFYGGLGVGFALGFLGIIASLTWIKKWRYALFQLSTQFEEWILLVVALSISKISRKIQFK